MDEQDETLDLFLPYSLFAVLHFDWCMGQKHGRLGRPMSARMVFPAWRGEAPSFDRQCERMPASAAPKFVWIMREA